MENNILNIEEFKTLERLCRERLGDKFVIGYMDGTDCHTYLSEELTDIEICYISDTINKRRE